MQQVLLQVFYIFTFVFTFSLCIKIFQGVFVVQLFCVCMYVCECVTVLNVGLIFLLPSHESQGSTEVVRLGDRQLYLLTHLAGLTFYFLIGLTI